MNKIKQHIVFAVLLIIGIGMMIYPTVNYLYSSHVNTKVVATYNKSVSHMSITDYKKILNRAYKYNHLLYLDRFNFSSRIWKRNYNGQINVGSNGIMGYIDIAEINVHLPIYHGSSNAVLQIGAGHLEYTSLPVGGKNTHSVISAHTGLPSARMFDEIHKMKVGSHFTVHVLKKTLTYQVDQIIVVNPNQTKYIKIESGKDLCSLVTCTPMGLNNKRLLVRGHRIKQSKIKKKNISYIETIPTYAYIALAVLFIAFIGGVAYKKKNCCSR